MTMGRSRLKKCSNRESEWLVINYTDCLKVINVTSCVHFIVRYCYDFIHFIKLPITITYSETIATFRKQIKTYLFEIAFPS